MEVNAPMDGKKRKGISQEKIKSVSVTNAGAGRRNYAVFHVINTVAKRFLTANGLVRLLCVRVNAQSGGKRLWMREKLEATVVNAGIIKTTKSTTVRRNSAVNRYIERIYIYIYIYYKGYILSYFFSKHINISKIFQT